MKTYVVYGTIINGEEDWFLQDANSIAECLDYCERNLGESFRVDYIVEQVKEVADVRVH